ncbi:MAG: adenylate kinase family protein [Thermoplasmata archaeon]|nr:adenylate kinase family protein [Thermoplasmata archaeon]
MRICISGTPGTGKTFISKKLGQNVINLNEFSKLNGCTKGYDKKRKSRIVDIECLKNKLSMGDVIIEGHYSHLIPCDLVIVLRTSPKVLRQRLKERNYDDKKIFENMEAEALGLITQEALEYNKNVYEIDTTNSSIDEIVKKIKDIIDGRGNDYLAGKIDYMEEILEWY